MSSSRKRSFRAPIVTVVAAFAPLLACEGGPDRTEPDARSDSGANPAACPAEIPGVGSPCKGAFSCSYGPRCEYVYSMWQHTARCTGKTFEVHSSICNPPVPPSEAGVDASIDAERPLDGASYDGARTDGSYPSDGGS